MVDIHSFTTSESGNAVVGGDNGVVDFFTICTRSYLGFAITLGRSVLRHHVQANFTIWILDKGEIPALPDGIMVQPIDQAFAGEDLQHYTLYYDVLEFATAVKPRCFMHHFSAGSERVIYIDPDILVFRPFKEVFQLLDEGHSGVLTPHITAPLPMDSAKPDDLEILQSGIYNLGFLALARTTAANELLSWWSRWLDTHCFADKSTGTFTDQKWMNFAPLFWSDTAILRDTTYNVAYWNLPQRILSADAEGWLVDSRALTFFHFSGLDPGKPDALSKHQTRIDVARGSPLGRLLRSYAGEVMGAGHREFLGLPCERVRFANGIAVDNVTRRAYREAVAQKREFTELLGTGAGSFFEWLTELVSGDSASASPAPITRYLFTMYEMRSDVRQSFPDLFGRDRAHFLYWVRSSGIAEMGASVDMVDYLLGKRRPGVNFAGYLRAELGLGEAARGYVRAMRAQGVDLSFVDASSLCSSRLGDESLDLPEGDEERHVHAINMIHINADQLFHFRDLVGEEFFAGRYNIGIWAWETPTFPTSWYDRFNLLDEIWVGGSFMANAIAKVSPIPVLVVPHVIEVPEVTPCRSSFGLSSSEVLYLFYFDFHSTPSRKNPYGVIEAFRRAFNPDESARLVIKSMNGHHRPDELQRLKEAAHGLRVTFIDETLDGLRRFELLASCDAFVSLHRAEGFGLGLAEAMCLGKPVIATGWSGNMDFMDVSNSFPVRYHLAPLETADPPYEAGSLWAVPDLDHAAQMMREVFDDRVHAARVGALAREHMQEFYNRDEIGRRISERLKLIADRRLGGAPVVPIAASSVHGGIARRLRRRSVKWFVSVWRLTLRIVPLRHHARLRRLTTGLRSRLISGY